MVLIFFFLRFKFYFIFFSVSRVLVVGIGFWFLGGILLFLGFVFLMEEGVVGLVSGSGVYLVLLLSR